MCSSCSSRSSPVSYPRKELARATVSWSVRGVMKFDLWNCEGKRFPPCFSKNVWVGFTKTASPCDVPDSVFGLHLHPFFIWKKIVESSTSWISRALECRLQKWLVKIAPPTIEKYHFSGISVVRSQRKLAKKKHHHFRLEVLVSGVYLVVATKFITPRKSVPWCWG